MFLLTHYKSSILHYGYLLMYLNIWILGSLIAYILFMTNIVLPIYLFMTCLLILLTIYLNDI